MESTTLVPFKQESSGIASLGANGGPILPSSDVLKEALGTALASPTDLDGLKALRSRLVAEKNKCLPIENALIQKLEAELREVDDAIVNAQVNESRQSPLSHLDLAVLSWRHSKKIAGVPVPKLALIDVNRGHQIAFRSSWSGNRKHRHDDLAFTEPGSSSLSVLQTSYTDVYKGLRDRLGRVTQSASLTFSFEGVIPSDTRKLLQEARRAFPAVYLLADAPTEAWRSTVETIADRGLGEPQRGPSAASGG